MTATTSSRSSHQHRTIITSINSSSSSGRSGRRSIVFTANMESRTRRCEDVGGCLWREGGGRTGHVHHDADVGRQEGGVEEGEAALEGGHACGVQAALLGSVPEEGVAVDKVDDLAALAQHLARALDNVGNALRADERGVHQLVKVVPAKLNKLHHHEPRALGQVQDQAVVQVVLLDEKGKVVEHHGDGAAGNVRVEKGRLVNGPPVVALWEEAGVQEAAAEDGQQRGELEIVFILVAGKRVQEGRLAGILIADEHKGVQMRAGGQGHAKGAVQVNHLLVQAIGLTPRRSLHVAKLLALDRQLPSLGHDRSGAV
eukprot:m.159970 g.159970  ORF g.159970 m.159970 type:complete len:314 (-) comp17048_c2_seq2:167-1108(-)